MFVDNDKTNAIFKCPDCGCKSEFFDIREVGISSIERISEDTWSIKGNVDVRCPNCACIYKAIIRDVKIQCAPFSCPKCNKNDNLNFNVRNLSKIGTDSDTYKFNAEIVCEKCHNKISLIKILKNLFSFKKIKISPTEFSIEK